MTPLFKKLNFKNHKEIIVINCPPVFELELHEMKNEITIIKDLKNLKEVEFAICFVINQKELDSVSASIIKKASEDPILWFCYPKATSKNYKCDFNRDTGWAKLGKLNFEPVRQIAIDLDWSALRFRKVEFIKNITRRESFALTKNAKKRTTQKAK